MTWRLAHTLDTLRGQINDAYPDRDRTSDGTIGDAAHAARDSDHNPNSAGVVTALDIDEDLAAGLDADGLVDALLASRDRRIKYVIYERSIWFSYAYGRWPSWTKLRYLGTNPHDRHVHISVMGSPGLYDDRTPWRITRTSPTTPEEDDMTAEQYERLIDNQNKIKTTLEDVAGDMVKTKSAAGRLEVAVASQGAQLKVLAGALADREGWDADDLYAGIETAAETGLRRVVGDELNVIIQPGSTQ